MAGILDWMNDPVNQGLLSLSSGLLQAGGPQPFPNTFGQALGRGIQSGLGGFNIANEAARRHQQTQAIVELERLKAAQLARNQQIDEGILTQAGLLPGPQAPTSTPQGPGMVPSVQGPSGVPGPSTGPAPSPMGANPGQFPLNLTQITALKLAGRPDLLPNYKESQPNVSIQNGFMVDPRYGILGGVPQTNQQGFSTMTVPDGKGGFRVQVTPGGAEAYGTQQRIGEEAKAATDLVTIPSTAPNQPPRYTSRAELLKGVSPVATQDMGRTTVKVTTPEGDRVNLNGVTKEQIAEAAKDPASRALLEKAGVLEKGQAAGMSPVDQAKAEAIKAAETAYGQKLGEGAAKVVADGAASALALRQIDQIMALGQELNTGKLEPFKVGIGQWLMGSGLATPEWVKTNITDVPRAEAIMGAVNKLVATAVRQTDAQPAVRQIEMLQKSYPQIFQTKEGFNLLGGILRDAHVYNLEKLKAQQEFLKSGGEMKDFEAKWAEDSQKLPLFKNFPANPIKDIVNSAPKPGTVKDGWRFKGGDPSQKMNWEKVGG